MICPASPACSRATRPRYSLEASGTTFAAKIPASADMTESTPSPPRRDQQAPPGEHPEHQKAVPSDAFGDRLEPPDVETEHGSPTVVEPEGTGRVYAPASARVPKPPALGDEALVEHVDTSTPERRQAATKESSSEDQ